MFCKHAEGNKINQKMKKYILKVALWKRGTNSKTFNCELFQESKVAVSELAGSVEENLRSLPDKNYKLINEKVKTFY